METRNIRGNGNRVDREIITNDSTQEIMNIGSLIEFRPPRIAMSFMLVAGASDAGCESSVV